MLTASAASSRVFALVALGALVAAVACSGDSRAAGSGADAAESRVQVPTDLAWGGGLAFGPHPVGFDSESFEVEAAEGAGASPGPRTLTLSLWYPARAGASAERMTLGAYLALARDEGQLPETDGLSGPSALAAAMTGVAGALDSARADEALAAPVNASRGAPMADGLFPTAVWGARHATVLAQAPLSEVLASHGFVVVNVWSSDPPLAFLWEDHPGSEKVATIAAQAADLHHALSRVRARGFVDPERAIALAWSYGGQTVARLQAMDPSVRGVIGLDANVVPARPEESLELRVPLVWLLGDDTGGRGFQAADALTAPWTALRLPALAHGNFNALESLLPSVLDASEVYPWARGGEIGRIGYLALTRIVVEASVALVATEPPAMEPLSQELRERARPLDVEVRVGSGGA